MSPEGSNSGSSGIELDSRTLREHLFVNAINILKKTDDIMRDARLDRWAWHSRTYVQWHTLALTLLEICIRPPSPQCDEAWEYATAVYDKWLSAKYRDSTESGDAFVKPMNQLLARTRRVREMQQASRQQRRQPQYQTPTQTQTQIPRRRTDELIMPGQQTKYNTPGSQASLDFNNMDISQTIPGSHQSGLGPMGISLAPIDISGNGLPVYGVNDFVPFLEMLPDELQNEWFESMARGNSMSPPSQDTVLTRPFLDFP